MGEEGGTAVGEGPAPPRTDGTQSLCPTAKRRAGSRHAPLPLQWVVLGPQVCSLGRDYRPRPRCLLLGVLCCAGANICSVEVPAFWKFFHPGMSLEWVCGVWFIYFKIKNLCPAVTGGDLPLKEAGPEGPWFRHLSGKLRVCCGCWWLFCRWGRALKQRGANPGGRSLRALNFKASKSKHIE